MPIEAGPVEGAPSNFVEPRFSQRIVASMADGLLLIAVSFVLSRFISGDRALGFASTAVSGFYTVTATTLFGRTLGKLVVHLQVIDHATGALPHLGQALARWLVLGFGGLLSLAVPALARSALPAGLGILVIAPILSGPLHRGLHDRAAGTIVTVS